MEDSRARSSFAERKAQPTLLAIGLKRLVRQLCWYLQDIELPLDTSSTNSYPFFLLLVLQDFGEKFLRCSPRPHIGSFVGRIVRCGEAMMSAAVDFDLPIDLGLTQLLDREI